MATSSSDVMGSEWWTGLVGTAHGPLLPHHSRFLASEVFVRLVASNRKGTSDHITSLVISLPLSVAYSNIQYGFWASGIGPTSEMNLLLVQLQACDISHSLVCFHASCFPLCSLWAPSLSVPALPVWQVRCWMTKLQWCKSIQTVIWNVCIDSFNYITAKSLHVHTSYFACTTKILALPTSPVLICAQADWRCWTKGDWLASLSH